MKARAIAVIATGWFAVLLPAAGVAIVEVFVP